MRVSTERHGEPRYESTVFFVMMTMTMMMMCVVRADFGLENSGSRKHKLSMYRKLWMNAIFSELPSFDACVYSVESK